MSEGSRVHKVEKEIHDIIAGFLRREVTLPPSTMASVTRVDVSKDLRNAKVFVSLFGAPELEDEGFEIIEEYHRELQLCLGRNLKTKFCPKVRLIRDHSFEQMEKVDKILKDIKKK